MKSKHRPRLLRWVIGLSCAALLAVGTSFGWCHWDLVQAALAYRRGDWHNVRRHAAVHLEAYPQSHFMCDCREWALLLLARSSRELSDWPRAERVYRSMKWMPVQDLRALGQYYGSVGRTVEQTQVCEQIRSIDPHDTNNLMALGQLWQWQHENPHRAVKYFEEATRLAPERIDGWVSLVYSYVDSGQHQKAARCLEQAIALDPPEVWRLHWLLGDVLLEKIGDTERAGKELRRALELNPDDAESLMSLSKWCLQQNPPDLASARQYLKRALRVKPDDPKVLIDLAELDLLEQDWEAAIKRVEPLLATNPNSEDAHRIKRMAQRRESPRPAGAQREIRAEWYFTEVAEQIGVLFRHTAGENEEMRYFPETLGSGVAVFDFDGDGFVDLYFLNYNFLGPDDQRRSPTIRNRLYRNRGDGSFEDVTDRSGLGDSAPSHGVSIGDYDNDGDKDVYVTNYGPNKLYRNNGDGTFTDVTEPAGASDRPDSMSTSAAWFDYENDGDLDLYVCNYSIYDVHHPVDCKQDGRPIYCGPEVMQNQRDTLYRNNGDGTFADVTEEMGIGRNENPDKMGKGLGVVAAHLNDDDDIDLAVANDSTRNFMFLGDGGKLIDASEASNFHVNKDDEEEACMGIDAADVDGDGDFDLYVTNQWGEKNTLYRNWGGFFRDDTDLFGLTAPTRQAVGWGTGFVDFDSDGDLDLFVTNGHFYDWRDTERFRQRATLWKNAGQRFESAGERAGPFFAREFVGRGAAFGDLDNDGDTDVVLNQWNEACAVLRNDTKTEGAWIRLELVGRVSNRDAVGARVQVRIGERTLYRQLTGGSSYLSDHDSRLLIGLGAVDGVDQVEVRWPSGQTEQFPRLEVNRAYRLVEGKGLQPLDGPLARR